ncbi:MAG: HAD family hydrolase [Rhizobiaceae bacterium]
MSEIQHIVFDVGRVLIHWDAELIYRDLIPDESQRTEFLEICAPWNAEQDRGVRNWREAEDELISVHPEKEEWIRAYRRDWHKSIPHAHEETVEVMRALIEAGVDVTLLTNFNDETWREAQAKFPFLVAPRGVTVSAEVKLIKPERAIFERHADTFDLTPERTLFFDDSPVNIKGAGIAGWQAERYEGAMGGEALREILVRYRLST